MISAKIRLHMVFIDVVIAGVLSQTENRNFVEFLIAVACRDGSTAVKCTLKLSKMQNCSNSDVFLKVNYFVCPNFFFTYLSDSNIRTPIIHPISNVILLTNIYD